MQIGPIHPKFISWNEAVHEFDTSKCYERLRVGERFSPASSPLVDASTTPSSSALNDNDDDGGDDAVREFPWTQRWFRVELTLPATPCVSAGASSHEEDEVSAQHVETSQDGGGQKCDQYLYFVAHGEFTVYTNSGDVWCGIDPVHDRVPISPLLQQRIDDQTSSSCTVWLDGGECDANDFQKYDTSFFDTLMLLTLLSIHQTQKDNGKQDFGSVSIPRQ